MKSYLVKEVRGRGLFHAMEFVETEKVTGNDFAKILMKNGLLTKATHTYAMRFAPALVITEDEIYESAEIIRKSLKELEEYNESKKWVN